MEIGRNGVGKVRHKFDLVVVQNVGWDRGGDFKPADGRIFFLRNCC